MRLQPIVLRICDIAYGGENGFNQAIELTSDTLSGVKFIHEKKVVGQFFDEIARDTGKYVFGLKDTMDAIDNGAVNILIVYENLKYNRLMLRDNANKITYKVLPTDQSNQTKFKDEETQSELEVIDNVPLTEYFMDNYKNIVSKMEIITDKTSEGNQYVKGFGGIGGILRYKMDAIFDENDDDDNGFNDDDFI